MRRQRVRSHVTADVGVKHVEYLVALAGFVTLIVPGGSDYGFDLPMLTFDSHGHAENGYVFLQVKSSKRVNRTRGGAVTVRLKRKHLRHWLNEPMPVIVIRYDCASNQAYWLYVQRHFANDPKPVGHRKSVTVRIPQGQVLSVSAVKQFAAFKARVIMQVAGAIDHG